MFRYLLTCPTHGTQGDVERKKPYKITRLGYCWQDVRGIWPEYCNEHLVIELDVTEV